MLVSGYLQAANLRVAAQDQVEEETGALLTSAAETIEFLLQEVARLNSRAAQGGDEHW